jgi:Domain of unknown function (DUF5127)
VDWSLARPGVGHAVGVRVHLNTQLVHPDSSLSGADECGFISLITPNDMMRQSLIFSYLDVSVQALDGNSQLYADTSAGKWFLPGHPHARVPDRPTDTGAALLEWISGDRSVNAQWEYGVTWNVVFHRS